ncbi:MAG: ABC transporter ATP-binding protein [Thiolinea sp.]
MDNNILIEATALSRFYGGLLVVDSFDLTLKKGEVLGLLGPNGAGKSTTMQMLAGNLAPGTGEIQINGIDLLDEPRRAKCHIGYLPEQPPVYRDLTVNEYLLYCAGLHGMSRGHAEEAVGRAKQRCNLMEVDRRLIGNLSKGFQQRVGIAQAILHQPDVIILDEPTVGLDPIQIREIRALIRELGEEHGVILSTHILPEVQAVCDRVQILNRGRTVFAGNLSEIDSLEKTFFKLIYQDDPALAEQEGVE